MPDIDVTYVVLERHSNSVELKGVLTSVVVALKFCAQLLRARGADTRLKANHGIRTSLLASSKLYGLGDDCWLELHAWPLEAPK
jgi:hypothetical protein